MLTQEELDTGEWVRELSAKSYRGWKAFYHTTRWKHKRKDILKRDHNSCRICRQKGKYTRATTVHHIKHLQDAPELALTDSNLISLCYECHHAAHPEKYEKFCEMYSKKRKGFINDEKW